MNVAALLLQACCDLAAQLMQMPPVGHLNRHYPEVHTPWNGLDASDYIYEDILQALTLALHLWHAAVRVGADSKLTHLP